MTNLRACLLLALLSISSVSAAAEQFVFALSQQQRPEQLMRQVKATIEFMAHQNKGDEALFVDVDHLLPLGTFSVPMAKYDHPKQRMAFNKALLKRLKTFADGAAPSTQPVSRLPQLLSYVADNVSYGKPVTVVYLGNVLFHDPKTPFLSFSNGRFPSDAYLSAPAYQSPFSAPEGVRFKGMKLYLSYGDSPFFNSAHEYYVKRFYTLYLTRQGGTLHSWTRDTMSLLKNLKDQSPALPAPEATLEGVSTDKMEMIKLGVVSSRQALFERPVEAQPTQLPKSTISRMTVAIRWECACDLDIYVKPSQDAEVISFQKSKTAWGQLYKDYVTAPKNTLRGFETIALSKPVQLDQVKMAVNFYSGAAPTTGAVVEVRVDIDGQIYAKRYRLNATQGNRGKDAVSVLTTGSTSKYTVRIDPRSIVNS